MIVAEALANGMVVSDVACRRDISPPQLFGWMRQCRDAALATIAPPPSSMFTPAVRLARAHPEHPWLAQLLVRKTAKVAAVALANRPHRLGTTSLTVS